MKCRVLAVGQRMPAWVDAGVNDYTRRLPRGWDVTWHTVPPARRQRHPTPAEAMAEEGERLLRSLREDTPVVALDRAGEAWDTPTLARRVESWQALGRPVTLVIGGADGLDTRVLERARWRWSLSPLTLPHPLVRVVLAEQLYRVWSLLAHHPYHK